VRRNPEIGDFVVTGFEVEDLLVTVQNPQFRPYTISIFHAILPRLRKQWLLHDCLTADSAVGMFDDCLFSIHQPQSMDSFSDEDPISTWSKIVSINFNI
jgi:distribution and morphology protein 31